MIGERIELSGAGAKPISAIHVKGANAQSASLIVLHEIFGLDRFMLDDIARWRDLGYEVLAPSLFDRIDANFSPERNAEGIQRGLSAAKATPDSSVLTDIAGASALLNPLTPTFVLGYCYGGRLAWRAACEIPHLAGAVVYYGNILPHILDKPLSPVICHFGAQDEHMPVRQIIESARVHHPEMNVHVYEDGGHGFNNTGKASSPSNAALLARQRTLDFFCANR